MAEIVTHVIRLPQPAKLFNMNTPPTTVGERISADSRKAIWRDAAFFAVLAHFRTLKIALPLRPATVQVDLPVPDRRVRDPHNFEQNAKHITDGCALAGLWPGDDPRYVLMLPTTLSLQSGRIERRHVTITITEGAIECRATT